ncbi:MAG: methyltransferase domain-containing protein [Cyclobacteriaceae bacterium]
MIKDPYKSNEYQELGLEEKVLTRAGDWVFDEAVSEIFDIHVRRSIPLYEEAQNLIGAISQVLLKKDAIVYDLGTSSGEVINSIWKVNMDKNITFYAVDNSQPMLAKAQEKLAHIPNITYINQNIQNVDYVACDMIISAYTLQFIPVQERLDLLIKLQKSIRDDGSVLIFEKIVFNDELIDNLLREIHENWKLKYFSREQIEYKKNQLRQVMRPLNLDENIKMIEEAGFMNHQPIFQWGNFIGILAY